MRMFAFFRTSADADEGSAPSEVTGTPQSAPDPRDAGPIHQEGQQTSQVP
jgi:hypothetical protein